MQRCCERWGREAAVERWMMVVVLPMGSVSNLVPNDSCRLIPLSLIMLLLMLLLLVMLMLLLLLLFLLLLLLFECLCLSWMQLPFWLLIVKPVTRDSMEGQ